MNSRFLPMPYGARLNQDGFPPEIPAYEPKSYTLYEQFNKKISEYFRSCYTGVPYMPPKYTKEELAKLCHYINTDGTTFLKNTQTAHRVIKKALETPEKVRKVDKARRL